MFEQYNDHHTYLLDSLWLIFVLVYVIFKRSIEGKWMKSVYPFCKQKIYSHSHTLNSTSLRQHNQGVSYTDANLTIRNLKAEYTEIFQLQTQQRSWFLIHRLNPSVKHLWNMPEAINAHPQRNWLPQSNIFVPCVLPDLSYDSINQSLPWYPSHSVFG